MPCLSCCSLVAQRLAVLVLPSSLAASPPALFCSALLQGPVHPCPLLHKLCFPGRLEERGAQCHATWSLRSWPWSQQLLLSPMPELLPLSHKMFSLCLVAPSLPSVPRREQWDVRAGAPLERCPVPGLQAPGLGWFWDTCALRTGGASLVHSLASVRALHVLSCHPLCVWLLPLTHGQVLRQA